MSLIRTTTALALAVAAVLGPNIPLAAAADHVTHSGVVSAVPAAYTPEVNDGAVHAIAQTGTTVVIGGDFTSVSPQGDASTIYPVDHIAAFTAGTGAITTTFAPTINGMVNAVLPGPQQGTVYVGGDFTQIDGVTSHLALINTTTGALVPGWTSPSFTGPAGTTVNSLAISGNTLFVGGTFSSVGGQSRQSLVALNPATGAVRTAYSTPSFSGHHNYQRLCIPSSTVTCANAAQGIRALDVNPAGTRLVAVGNFTTVGTQPRDQLAVLDVGSSAATVDRNWATSAYTSPCDSVDFDTYVRGVQFSPDGSYFVVASSGGTRHPNSDGTRGICDAAARFDTGVSSSDVLPTWVDYTGRDTFLSVAITGPAVYIGGHERWVNNSVGADTPGEGAVPRPGITALDPINGMPLAWNPGRNPRGAGAWSLLATSDGLYVGSDTDYIGLGPSRPAQTYVRKKLAFFPLAGGKTLAANLVTSLPGNVYLLGTATDTGPNNGGVAVPFNGEAPPSNTIPLGGVSDWASTVRGAFEINDTVYYGSTDGNFYQRSFDGLNFGPPIAVDPYHDPVWDGVPTGSNGENYDGTPSAFYSSIPSLTSLFYFNGRVYYTVAGKSHMFWRWFEPDSGVMGADEFTTTDTIDWSNTAGAFLSGSVLYFATSTNGNLRKIAFTGGEPTGSSTLADKSINWSSHGAFVMRANSTTDLTVSPHGAAHEGQSVTLTATVSLSGDPSSHPAGTVIFYNRSARLNHTPVAVDPSTGRAQLTVSDLPPSGPGKTVLAATFQPSDTTVNASFSPAVTYTVNPVATKPTVSGRARVGATDRCSEPTRPGENAAYSWLAGHKVVAKGRSYTIGAVALHRMLRCRVALSIGKGAPSVATSTGKKVARGPALKATSKPKLRGPHRVGATESVTLGKWHPRASSYKFQWYVGHKKIHHGAKRTLHVKRSAAGKRLRCRVTAHRPGFAKGTATTKQVKVSR